MVISARHRWPEAAGFVMNRPTGIDSYTFLHFFHPVQLRPAPEQPVVHTKPDACILYRPDTPQWFYSEVPLVHDWMHLTVDTCVQLAQFDVPLDTVVYPSDCAFLTAGISEIELEICSRRPHRQVMADAAAEMLLIRFARANASGDDSASVSPELRAQLTRLRTRLFAHLGEAWSVERMAAEVQLSPSRFHAVYQALFAISPMNDLIQARIDAAKSALTGSSESIAQLSERLGYANVTHFSRQFRQRTGVSPRTYAKK